MSDTLEPEQPMGVSAHTNTGAQSLEKWQARWTLAIIAFKGKERLETVDQHGAQPLVSTSSQGNFVLMQTLLKGRGRAWRLSGLFRQGTDFTINKRRCNGRFTSLSNTKSLITRQGHMSDVVGVREALTARSNVTVETTGLVSLFPVFRETLGPDCYVPPHDISTITRHELKQTLL